MHKGFNEGKGRPFEATDIRFTTKGDVLYATVLKWPENGKVKVRSLGGNSILGAREIRKVELLGGSGELLFECSSADLEVILPDIKSLPTYAIALKITMVASRLI